MSKEIKNTDLSMLSREELEKRYIELNTKYDSAVACLVHVRRKLAEALKLLPPKDRENTSANLAIKKIVHM